MLVADVLDDSEVDDMDEDDEDSALPRPMAVPVDVKLGNEEDSSKEPRRAARKRVTKEV